MSDQALNSLNESELAELDAFLLSDACDEALAIDEVHGFLTALLIAGGGNDWLPVVWGEPNFADEAEAQRMAERMQRLYQEIEHTLQNGGSFEPLVIEFEEEGELLEAYEGWCFGFMLGVEQNQAKWDALSKDDQALLAPMAQLALLGSEEEADMDGSEYDSWVELLPGAVMALYKNWHRPDE